MSEDLKQAGGNEALERPVELTARFSPILFAAARLDLRTGRYFGPVERWTFTLDPWQPSLFALLPEAQPVEGLVEALLGSR